MPLYEYKCDRCGELFEVIEKFSDKPLEQHEACGGHVERQLSVSALQFKGTGWYVTDYAKGSGAGKSAKGESKDGGSNGSKSESSKSESSKSESSKSDSSKSESSKPAASTPAPANKK